MASPPLVSPAVIDLSAHLLHGLPGLTDTPPDLESALAMARGITEAGTTTVVATATMAAPDPALIGLADAARTALAAAVREEGIDLDILPGLELSLDAVAGLDDESLVQCTIGRGGRWLLVALPDTGWPIALPALMQSLEMRGLGIVIAHPERCESVQLSPDRLRDPIGRGALIQVDCSSFGGWHGARAERSAYGLLRAGMANVLASGAHWDRPYPLGLEAGLLASEHVLRRTRAELMWMVETGPSRIVAGEPVRSPRMVPVPRGGFEPA